MQRGVRNGGVVHATREFRPKCYLPRIHPAVYNRIVHGVAHCQPIDNQIQFLNERRLRDGRIARRHDEVRVEGQPADAEY